MKMYTVVLLYPDTATEDYGGDLYVNAVAAEDPYKAAERVQAMASDANDGEIEPEDFRPILVLAGDVEVELDASNF